MWASRLDDSIPSSVRHFTLRKDPVHLMHHFLTRRYRFYEILNWSKLRKISRGLPRRNAIRRLFPSPKNFSHKQTLTHSQTDRHHTGPCKNRIKKSARGNFFGGHVCASWPEMWPRHGRRCPSFMVGGGVFPLAYYLKIAKLSKLDTKHLYLYHT